MAIKPATAPRQPQGANAANKYEPRPEQSVALLQALHILTRDGKLNQDTRRKLKQIQHLLGFIEPLLRQSHQKQGSVHLVDHGAGKSYLGFLLFDTYFKKQLADPFSGTVVGVERRADLVENSQKLAQQFGFEGMQFIHSSVNQANHLGALPSRIDVVTALHACDTATDDALTFALEHQAEHVVLVPCCQAEIAAYLRSKPHKTQDAAHNPLMQMWRRPLHTREFGSHITNVLRCLRLEAHGYHVTVTELVGWEHSMKNELIVASKPSLANGQKNGASHSNHQAQQQAREHIRSLLQLSHLADNPAICARYL